MTPVAGSPRSGILPKTEKRWWTAVAPWLLVAAALGGCQTRGYVRDPGLSTQGRDWSEAKPLRIELTEYAFSPQVLELQENTAYALEVANAGAEPHEFSAEEFFRAVAVGRVVVRGLVALSPARIEAIRLEPGAAVELLLVAVRPGTYPISSHMAEDRRRGMGAAVRIAPESPVR